MARRGQQTGEEILRAEQAADARKRGRANGYSLMKERDFGVAELSSGAVMSWHVPKPTEGDYVWRYIPEDSFELRIKGKKYLFNTEEFRRALRWA